MQNKDTNLDPRILQLDLWNKHMTCVQLYTGQLGNDG